MPVRSGPGPRDGPEDASTRNQIREAVDAGFQHITLGIPAPYPDGVAQWIAAEIIAKS